MLKVDLEKGYVAGSGDVLDLATDILYVIDSVYGALSQKNKNVGDAFKQIIVQGVSNPVGPMFRERNRDTLAYVAEMRKKDSDSNG